MSHWLRVGRDDVLDRGHGDRPPACGATAREERVAQDAHQVIQLIVTAQHAWPGEHARKCFLHEILRVLFRSAQGPRRAIEAVDVLWQRLWVQGAH